ncbi:hypothetical protein ACXR2U_13040 [Jatrophihabitans sp. YIM 134969]
MEHQQTAGDPGPGLPTWVVIRPEDQLRLEVSFQSFTATPTPGGPVTMVAADLAAVVVTFGTQAEYEQKLDQEYPWPPGGLAGSDPSGLSTLTITVPTGTVVPVTVDGVLGAIGSFPVWVPPAAEPRYAGVEMPAGLVLAPAPRVSGEPVTLHHPVTARTHAGTTALWQTEVTAPSGLQAMVLDAFGDVQPTGSVPHTTDGPLFQGQRAAILSVSRAAEQSGTPVRPTVERMRLSALGGTLTAHGTWGQPSVTGDGDTDPGAVTTTTWQHDLALGRDRRVLFTQPGVLLPFGHAAVLVELAERSVETEGSGGVALMRVWTTVHVQPVREYVAGAPGVGYAFPFDRAEVLTTTIAGLDPVTLTGTPPQGPLQRGSVDVQVPVRLSGALGPVDVAVAMVFVGAQTSDLDESSAATPPGRGDHEPPPHDLPHVDPPSPAGFDVAFATARIPVPAVPVDLVRAAAPKPSDVHIVHGITVQTLLAAGGAVDDPLSYVPTISSVRVDPPAVRTLLPPGVPSVVDAALSDELADVGAQATTVLQDLRVADVPAGEDAALVLAFAGDPQRSGALVSPSLVADTVSRELGPTAKALLSAAADSPVTDSVKDLFGEAELLGLSLRDLLPTTMGDLPVPQILQLARTAEDVAAGKPPPVTLTWTGLKPLGKDSFLASPDGHDTTLDLSATVSADASTVQCVLSDFALAIPDRTNPLLTVTFGSLTFDAQQGRPPTLTASGVAAHFGGDLDVIAMLEKAVDFGDAGQLVRLDADGITASYSFSAPEVSAGVICLRNVDFGASAVVPFTGDPVSIAMHFATRDNPFTATVLAFGGGGYVDLLVDTSGMRRFEGSLDFGAQLAVDFIVAAGEVHAFGGVRFLVEVTATTTDITASAFLRFGGSLQVLGVVTVSVELSLELSYARNGDHSTLSGRATLVIDVDVTIWSDSVELDSGEWVIAGGRGDDHVAALDVGDEQHAAWQAYRAAFGA